MKNKMVISPYLRVYSAVKIEGWRGICNLFQFFDILSRHFETHLHTMKRKLTEHALISIFFMHRQKIWWNSNIQTFDSKILKIRPSFKKKRNCRFRDDLWRNIYVTPWPILLILVWMDRRDQYLSIKTKFRGGSFTSPFPTPISPS